MLPGVAVSLSVAIYDTNVPMTKVLEDAIEKVRRLPEDQQAYVAEILEQIAAARGDPFVVPDSHRAAVLEGLAQIRLTSQLLARYPALGRETDIAGVRVFPTARYPLFITRFNRTN